ncbi:MAG: DNA-3-methyladenine glycosylase [Flammeovirgaceae bacterium]|nr:MAG: DNA-3-methyladenine glycosylase [Flammeovirgaceae bacterium]
MKLPESFYQRNNVVAIARELLGKHLVTRIGNQVTSGLIVETEAYSWKERGCHAFNGRKTRRNEVMFYAGGHAYVYLCYGVHNLFNVVTNQAGVADAVLIRAIEPVGGISIMQQRRGPVANPFHLTSGPGKLTVSLGIDRTFNGKFLTGTEVWIEPGENLSAKRIEASKRIGVDYAGKDAKLPWRFTIKGNAWVSK